MSETSAIIIEDGEVLFAKHEIAFCFFMKPRGSKWLNSKSYSQGVREHMCWLPINKLNEYTAYPKFLADKLLNIKDTVEHIVTLK